MPRTKAQYEMLRNEKRELIMQTALRLFAENGYVHTGIDRIAKEVGISKGLLYNYFSSKDDLLTQVLLMGIAKVSDNLFPTGMNDDTFLESIENVLDNIERNKDFFRLYSSLSMQPTIIKRLAPLSENSNATRPFLDYMTRRFGENALSEMLLFSTLIKGYSILALFGDGQRTIPTARLKETVLNALRERYERGEGNKL